MPNASAERLLRSFVFHLPPNLLQRAMLRNSLLALAESREGKRNKKGRQFLSGPSTF